jgi:hypothetical protein
MAPSEMGSLIGRQLTQPVDAGIPLAPSALGAREDASHVA